MPHTIYHNFVINSSKEKVFEGISSPDLLTKWWPDKCAGKAELNANYNFYFGPQYDWYGKVIKCEPSKSFHVKMTKADPDWDPTTFGFDLKEVKGRTQVSFWHSDWPESNDHFKKASFCWAMLLQGLKNYVEKGVIVPFEERQ